MKNVYLRTLKEFDYEDVEAHLLVVGDLKGDCFHCREIGIDYLTASRCPQCGTEFKYISSRQQKSAGVKLIAALHHKRPDLIFVELDDILFYKNRERAQGLFS